MICSLNQIEQTARKAARGGGAPWGLADEVGKALRWLHAYRLNGAAALAKMLDDAVCDVDATAKMSDDATRDATDVLNDSKSLLDSKSSSDSISSSDSMLLSGPVSLSGVWRARCGALDPLATGASLSDCFDDAGLAVETGVIAHPLLAAGFVVALAQIEDRAFALSWPQARLCCRRGGVRVEGTRRAVETAIAEFMRCRQEDEDAESSPSRRKQKPTTPKQRWRRPRIAEAEIGDAAWNKLEQYAARTYVEASEASRLVGAGAGLHDND
ncbi:MAG: DUF3726 domain-containing protein [bacterium]